MTYECANGTRITVTYTGKHGDTAVFEDQGETIVMHQVPSGSGALYQADDPDYAYELSTKGDEATFFSGPDEIWLDDCLAVD